MGHLKTFFAGSGLSALMLLVGGCDTGDRVQEPPATKLTIGATDITDSSEFDRELIAAKTGNDDPARRDQAMIAVLDKYGIAYPRGNAFRQPPAAEPADGADPIGRAAAKTAFKAASFNPLRRDISMDNDIHTYWGSVTVANGQFVAAAAIGNTANVDPFLVAYYLDGQAPDLVKVVAFNDDIDGGNRNSVINWTNNTGSTKHVEVIAFAFSPFTRGQAHIVLNTTLFSQSLLNREIGGLSQYGANGIPEEPSNCFPHATRGWLRGVSGSPDIGNVLVFDSKAMRGGILHVLSVNGEKFLEFPWIVNNDYPSFALFFIRQSGELPSNWRDLEAPTSWRFIQRDNYSCVN